MHSSNNSQNLFEISSDEEDLTISGEVNFHWKVIIIYALIISSFTLLFVNIFKLQIIEGSKNFLVATRTNQNQTKQLAPRGLIYDIKGNRLAYNVPSYSLYINPNELIADNTEANIKNLANLIGDSEEEFWDTFKGKAYDEDQKIKNVDRITLKSDLTFDQYYSVLSKIDQFDGVYFLVEPIRLYVYPMSFSNILGYVGDPGEVDISNGIYSESQVGKIGVERVYDDYLRGEEGYSVTQKEVLTGNENEVEVFEPRSGDNLFLSIDANWQNKLSEIISNQISDVNAFAGAGVIMNSKTGKIKALVTVPSYDSNLFAKGISNKEYNELINNPKQPLFNRAISMQISPGSIMKIFAATSALESGIIDENTKYLSNRCIDLPGNIKFCEADQGYIGWVNVKEALARSSNIFFCKVIQDLHSTVGFGYYYDITRSYGIGIKTGIDLIGEASGVLPSAAYKKKITTEPWYIGDECNTVIGQGYVTVTPLQMTVAISAIVNGGDVLKPSILENVKDQNGDIVFNKETELARKLNVSSKTLNILKAGLRMGVTAGTAGGLKDLPGNSVGKTGSADASENIMGKIYSGAHSWVMGCFDFEGENYCFTVVQQLGGRGYKTVPIMRKFINCVYNNFENNCDAI